MDPKMPVPTKSSESIAFEAWCRQELSRLLKFPVENDLVSYLLSMTTNEVEEYLQELLGKDSPRSREFQREFLVRWHPPERPPSLPSPEEVQLLQELVRPKQEDMVLFEKKGGGGGRYQKGKEKKEDSSIPPPPPGFSAVHATTLEEPSTSKLQPKPQSLLGPLSGSSGAHKRKFVPLMSAEGQSKVALYFPGRHPCQCLAQKHALINNCIECGRIVCSQEGPGPCLFCGTLVLTTEQEELLARDSKKAHKMKDKLLKQWEVKDGERAFDHIRKVESGEGLSKAIQHKEMLLEYGQTSVRQTRVIDDERDYFAVETNRWLSEQERDALQRREEELREKRHGSRRTKAITLDLAGRRVVEEDTDVEMYDVKNVQDLSSGPGPPSAEKQAVGVYNPTIPIDPLEPRKKPKSALGNGESPKPYNVRLQDRALQEMTDKGKCLSMHQPWASLLVAGIKRFEGRTWYTTHRGKLWITAAAQQPTPDDIESNENFYRKFYGDEELQFPKDYPVGCLLGCVDVIDCLAQEDYREQFPNGESEAPYVFVTKNPRELTVKFPVIGQHKIIWKLPPNIHTAAKKGCKASNIQTSLHLNIS